MRLMRRAREGPFIAALGLFDAGLLDPALAVIVAAEHRGGLGAGIKRDLVAVMRVADAEHLVDGDAVGAFLPGEAAIAAEIKPARMHAGEDAAALRFDHDRAAMMAIEHAAVIDPDIAWRAALQEVDAAERGDEQSRRRGIAAVEVLTVRR